MSYRLSSAHYPQSNGRAELAVKAAKRMLLGNCDDNGNIDNELIARSLLQYRNTPLQGHNLSPSQILYGRTLKDCIPSLKEAMMIREEWRIAADERETALRRRHTKNIDIYNEHSKELPELNLQDNVAVQNQNGNHPNRWDRTGKVIEKLPFRQYKVKMDGSNRVTLRNRKFLRKIHPICAEPYMAHLEPGTHHRCDMDRQRLQEPHNCSINTETLSPPTPDTPPPIPDTSVPPTVPDLPINNGNAGESTPAPDGLRRSARIPIPRKVFEASNRGKSHCYRGINDIS